MGKGHWHWQLTGPNGQIHGYVEAIDPRDALSRALTSEAASGLLVGEEADIPVDVLDEAPGNFESKFEASGEGFSIRVHRIDHPHPGNIREPQSLSRLGM